MKSASALCLSVIILFFNTSGYTQTPSTTPATGTSAVSGRILVKGEPARGVAVTLTRQASMGMMGQDSSPRARTDDNGVFRFTSVPRGQYQIRAIAPGYAQDDYSMFGGASKPLVVGEDENIENIELTLKPGGVITGRVVDSNGNPAVEEFIQLTKLDASGNPSQTPFRGGYMEMNMTDDRGIYRLYGIAEGRYLVSAGRPQQPGVYGGPTQSKYPQTFHPDATTAAQATKVEVTEGFVTENIDIGLKEAKQTYAILGRLISAETGQPLAGVDISYGISSKDRPGLMSYQSGGVQSGANGEFRLTGVAPGQYGVFAQPLAQSDFYGEPAYCTVVDSDVQGIEIRAHQGGSISGVAVLEGTKDPAAIAGLKNLMIYYFFQGPQPQRFRNEPTKISNNGSFQIKGLPPGNLMLSMMRTPAAPGLNLKRIEFNGAPVPREGIPIQKGESVTGVRMIVSYGVIALRGSIQSTGGPLPPGMQFYVSATPAEQPQGVSTIGAQVDQRGHFVIENMSAGEYELRVNPRFGPEGGRPDPQLMQALSRTHQRVTIAGDNPPPVTLVIDLSKSEGVR
jgi:protocatechuate 3,4-dioxygenase beta subunit